MDFYSRLVATIAVLVGLISLVVLLRGVGLVKEEQGPIFARLVTHVTLPALIFSSLAQTTLHGKQCLLALIMLVAEIVCLALAWAAGQALKLNRPQLGAMMLTAGFGSSSLLGYALISQVYPGKPEALTEAVIISELGVGPALFTLGTMIAIYYGSKQVDVRGRFKAALGFFVSPIFFSVVAGLIWSLAKIPTDSEVVDTVLRGFKLAGSANTLMVALTVGVLLTFTGLKSVGAVAITVGLIKLILKPIMVWLPTLGMNLASWEAQVLILEGAMPSAMLSVVLASSYGCDGKLASKLVFATTVASSVTILIMFRLLA